MLSDKRITKSIETPSKLVSKIFYINLNIIYCYGNHVKVHAIQIYVYTCIHSPFIPETSVPYKK